MARADPHRHPPAQDRRGDPHLPADLWRVTPMRAAPPPLDGEVGERREPGGVMARTVVGRPLGKVEAECLSVLSRCRSVP